MNGQFCNCPDDHKVNMTRLVDSKTKEPLHGKFACATCGRHGLIDWRFRTDPVGETEWWERVNGVWRQVSSEEDLTWEAA